MAARRPKAVHGPVGIGVDSHGGAVVDPTANVLQLVAAAIERQDDLRDLNNKLLDAEIRRMEQMIQHEHALAVLRADHAKDSVLLESERTKSIRAVDQLNASTASERVLAAVQTLAVTTTTNAQTLRDLVASTATTLATQTDKKFSDITERILAVERSISRGEGKEVVSDPMLAEMVRELKDATRSLAQGAGKGEGKNQLWGYIVGAIGLLFLLYDRFGK